MNQFFPHIFQPLQIGKTVFKNRVFLPPMTNHMLQDGSSGPSDAYIANRAEYAKNGAACVCLGGFQITENNKFRRSKMDIREPSGWKNWIKYTDAMHFFGAKASVEVINFGIERERMPGMTDEDAVALGATDCVMPGPNGNMRFRAMDEEDMDRLCESYADVAECAKYCGFDVLLIHGGHGTLFENFLSPLINNRTDQYNGTLENRARFPMMVLDRIRQRVGRDLLLELRMSGTHYIPNGWDIDECIQYLRLIQDKIDIAHISAGIVRTPHLRAYTHPTGFQKPIPNAWLAERVKQAGITIPVATIGGFQDPVQMEQILASGGADIIYAGRGFLADPEFLIKAREGRSDEIRPCIRCNTCLDDFKKSSVLSCSVNPKFGREEMLKSIEPKPNVARHVAVVGAGPAGIQAALEASRRGHQVVLFEREPVAGGLLHPAGVMSFKYYVKKYTDYLLRMLERSSVQLLLNTEATPELLRREGFDVVIVAIGAEPVIPPIPVEEGADVMTAVESYVKADQVGARVVVIGGGQVGCETALHYVQLGRKVTLLEMRGVLAEEEMRTNREELLKYIDEQVTALVNVTCTRIGKGWVEYRTADGQLCIEEADTVLLAAGLVTRRNEALRFADCAPEVYLIDNCGKSSSIRRAVRQGYDAAASIQ